jgi:arylsulfatase
MQPTPLMRDEKTIEEPAVQTTLTNRYTNEAIKFLDENRERPFFLYLPQTMPHVPLAVSEKFKGRSAGGLYGDVIEELDDSVGRILEALKKHNLDEKTLIVFSSDNGPWLIKKEHGGTAGPLRNGKGTLFEGGIRVPTLARWPGRIKAGSVANAPAIMTDWFPTIVKLAGGTVPMDRAIDGKDLAPVLFGKGERADQEFYFYQGNQLHAHRSGPWKVIQVGAGKPGVKPPRPMLFNLEDDLGETTDLAEQKPEILQRLIKQMEAFQQGLGKVTPPKM